MTKLNQESGRSMVEMLGVLAIIGVLSIGGIAGYTMAMNRYRANELLAAASMANVLAMSQQQGNGNYGSTETYSKLTGTTTSVAGVSGSNIQVTAAGTISITSGVDSGICDAMINIAGDSKVSCDGTGSATIYIAS